MQIACDTHVHCYNFSELGQQLDFAQSNFAKYAPSADARILFYTDGYVDRTWLKLNELIGSGLESNSAKNGSWVFALSQDMGLIEAVREQDGSVIYIAPARQLNTAGKLEMILLGCDEEIGDKWPANQLIRVYGDKYVPLMPWGVGKWLGKRGRVLIDLINHSSKPFILGDNGGRPFFWPVPHFRFMDALEAQEQVEKSEGDQGQNKPHKWVKNRLATMNGSDPLPVSGEICRTASYGILFDMEKGKEISLKNILLQMKETDFEFQNYGKLMGLFPFIIKRIKMLLR